MNDRGACLTEGELRAYADGEVLETDPGTLAAHLATCPGCRSRLEQIRVGAEATSTLIARLGSAHEAPDPAVAYQRLRQRTGQAQETRLEGVTLMDRIRGMPRRTAAAGALVIAIMVLMITVAPIGTLAQDVINRFRVQQFAAITIPMDTIQQFSGMAQAMDPAAKAQVKSELEALGQFSTTLGRESVHEASSTDEANAHLNGTLAVPSDLPSEFAGVQPKIFLGDAGTAQYTLDVAKFQEMAGRMNMSIAGLPDPAQTPTVTFTVNVSNSAAFVYEANGKRLIVGQTQSPTLDIPSSVDVDAVRESILPILPPDMAGQVRQIHDWKNTLIVPVPSDATTSQKSVNGVPALLIESKNGAAVLWQKDGTLYAVAGQAGASDVLSVADSMQ